MHKKPRTTRQGFDPTHPTVDSEARIIVFLFESPEPFMVSDGSTFSFVLDHPLPRMPKTQWRVAEGGAPMPQDADGQLFVSFRFWRAATTIEPPLPSGALMSVLEQVMPEGSSVITRVAYVGVEDAANEFPDQVRNGGPMAAPENSKHELTWESPTTIVEAVTVLLPSEHGASPVVEALHRCMASLAEFSRVYRLSNRLPMQTVTYERLPSAGVVWATRKLFDDTGANWDEGLELLVVPARMPGKTQHDELDAEAVERLGWYFKRYRGGHPLIAYSERGLEARIAFDETGDYSNCVIQVQTAIEVLFDGLLFTLLWEEGRDPETVAKDVFSESLHKRIRTHFSSRLGGDWDTTGRGAIAQWAQFVVPLRGRIVHAAYRPSREEAIRALEVMNGVDSFVRQRVADRRTRYMRTALMFLGQPGLERHGVWAGRMKRFVEEEADREPDWLETFRGWQADVLIARQRVSATEDE